MKLCQKFMSLFLVWALAVVVGNFECAAAGPAGQDLDALRKALKEKLQNPVIRLESYAFDPDSPLERRVGPAPDFLVDYLSQQDETRYAPYRPKAEDLGEVEQALSQLPQHYVHVLESKLIGIYFMADLSGSGWADWVVGPRGDMYNYIILSTNVLGRDISDWLSWKENTCFERDDPTLKIEIDAGNALSGIAGILMHESSHVIDYQQNLTPYVEMSTWLYANPTGEVQPTPFSKGVWDEEKKPGAASGFTERERVSFYGWGEGPKLKISQAAAVYGNLAKTPFVSLYGTLSWVEDFAETMLFAWLTQTMGQPYVIKVKKGDQVIYSVEPMSRPAVRDRLRHVQHLLLETVPSK